MGRHVASMVQLKMRKVFGLENLKDETTRKT